MTRVSQLTFGLKSTWPLIENAERVSMSWPVMSLTVNPSRLTWATEKPTASLSAITGPDTPPRTVQAPWLANGSVSEPVQPRIDGRLLVTLTSPPRVLRPNSALCGPRTNSIWSTSSSSRLDEFAFSCGTPSM